LSLPVVGGERKMGVHGGISEIAWGVPTLKGRTVLRERLGGIVSKKRGCTSTRTDHFTFRGRLFSGSTRKSDRTRMRYEHIHMG